MGAPRVRRVRRREGRSEARILEQKSRARASVRMLEQRPRASWPPPHHGQPIARTAAVQRAAPQLGNAQGSLSPPHEPCAARPTRRLAPLAPRWPGLTRLNRIQLRRPATPSCTPACSLQHTVQRHGRHLRLRGGVHNRPGGEHCLSVCACRAPRRPRCAPAVGATCCRRKRVSSTAHAPWMGSALRRAQGAEARLEERTSDCRVGD